MSSRRGAGSRAEAEAPGGGGGGGGRAGPSARVVGAPMAMEGEEVDEAAAEAEAGRESSPLRSRALEVEPARAEGPQRASHYGPGLMRIRSSRDREMMRLSAQVFIVLLLVASALMSLVGLCLGERFSRVPRRVGEDTFGPMELLWELEPPFLNRTHLEEPGNMWHPVMFPAESLTGKLQDLPLNLWNWGVRSIYRGRIAMKLFALLVGCCFWTPGFMLCAGLIQFLLWNQELIPLSLKGCYLRVMPADLLVLEQLIMGNRVFGRKFRPSLLAEIAAVAGPSADKKEGEEGEVEEVAALVEEDQEGILARRRNVGD